MSKELVIGNTKTWLEQVVIGLNLCPFAARPNRLNQIRYEVNCVADDQDNWEENILSCIESELVRLDNTKTSEIETTLIMTPNALLDFDEYNQFLDYTDFLIKRGGWEGKYQIASFHPEYCFADSHHDDAENLTNRSPYPTFHLIREASLEDAISKYPDTQNIPNINIERMNMMSAQEKKLLFPYLV